MGGECAGEEGSGRVVRNKVRQEIEHPTARQVANYIISFFQKKQEPITNLKLQKLLYYVQAWYLALYDEPLFDDKLEAWVHGASQPQVYSQFKQFLWNRLPRQCNVQRLLIRKSRIISTRFCGIMASITLATGNA